MGISAVKMVFEDILENGGRAIEIVFQRSQSDNVIQRNLVGKNGVIIEKKGDIYCIDCKFNCLKWWNIEWSKVSMEYVLWKVSLYR